jgi:hypothetical protein
LFWTRLGALSSSNPNPRWRLARLASFGSCLLLIALTLAAALLAVRAHGPAAHDPGASGDMGRVPTTTVPVPTPTVGSTTTSPAPTSTLAPPVAQPVPGGVTAVGDSVMIDYQGDLQADIPDVSVNASVSRQWSDGEAILQSLKAEGRLGSEVIVGLGTNGPITPTDFDNMMTILSGVTRVVFVNVHVDRDWQDPNNAVIASGVTRYANAALADWATLAAQNPQWFGPDGTHLAIDGPGAQALASLITSDLTSG